MASMSMTVNIGDLDRFRLLMWELRQLQDEMRVMSSPHTDKLEHLIDRFCEAGSLDLDRASQQED